MCGRYAIVSKVEKVQKTFKVKWRGASNFEANTNVSHGDLAPIISSDNPSEIQLSQFGYSPSWSKKQVYLINARAEGDNNKENDPLYTGSKGIISKPMFRKSIRNQRCLVPADCFIEGPKNEKLKKPYVVYLKKVRPFAFAGIWDDWVNQETGEVIKTFGIITTMSNSVTQAIGHHRSPVILNPEEYSAWLDPSTELGYVTSLLNPFDGNKMNAYTISAEIKNPRLNGLGLLNPIGERVFPEFDYEISRELKLFGMGSTTSRERRNNEGQQSLDF